MMCPSRPRRVLLPLLLLPLLLLLFHPRPPGAAAHRSLAAHRHLRSRAQSLLHTWQHLHGLPPAAAPPGGGGDDGEGPLLLTGVPPAPHIEECGRVSREREAWDSRAPGGGLPDWAADERSPQPPWIRGGDADNLAMTRVAQADFWRLQHPPDCKAEGVRFVVAEWMAARTDHGLGSQLHVMAASFVKAFKAGRVFVPLPGGFDRADHDGCNGANRGELQCYFFPATPPECAAEAGRLWEELRQRGSGAKGSPHTVEERLAGPSRVVYLAQWQSYFKGWTNISQWGSPWNGQLAHTELMGRATPLTEKQRAVNWFRAQAVRYLLRWPSERLCNVTNAARHASYGHLAARHVAAAEHAFAAALRAADATGGAAALAAAAAVKNPAYRRQDASTPSLADLALPDVAAGGQVLGLEGATWRHKAPWSPRPIVSVHVRQGDKGGEMRLFSLAAHMALANRLRLRVPDLRHVWLTTEMQSVVDEAAVFDDWTFLYTPTQRQTGGISIRNYERTAGLAAVVDASFANLLLAASCDFFVGTLGSNWNRLINELRETGGRLQAGYLTLNYGEW